MMLRDYQETAASDAVYELRRGRRVCLVAPTGAGKTVIGSECVARFGAPTSWITHRVELADQARGRLPADVQVVSVQSLLAGAALRSDVGLVVVDECHHLSASGVWRDVLPAGVPVLGLTATPQRGDGQPLADVFDRLVVAAQYSRLIADGHLVRPRVVAPFGAQAAVKPTQAARYVDSLPAGRCGFVYVAGVEDAHTVAAGITWSAVVTGDTPADERRAAVDALRSGSLRWIVNVGTMTEGTDVPTANTAIIARPVGTTGLWLQMCGRVMRPGGGVAEVHDLCGSVWAHGDPAGDRKYSLKGDGISKPKTRRVASVVICSECLTAYQGQRCPRCGSQRATTSAGKRVDLSDLVCVYSGSDTPRDAVAEQIDHWRASGMSWRRVRVRCRELFGAAPPTPWAPAEEQAQEWRRLLAEAAQHGRSNGWAAHRFRATFGRWPN